MIDGQRLKVSKEEVHNVTERVAKLSLKEVDELFLKCGFIYTEKAQGYQALHESIIDTLQGGRAGIYEVVDILIAETPKAKVLEVLTDIERSKTR